MQEGMVVTDTLLGVVLTLVLAAIGGAFGYGCAYMRIRNNRFDIDRNAEDIKDNRAIMVKNTEDIYRAIAQSNKELRELFFAYQKENKDDHVRILDRVETILRNGNKK